MIAQLLQHRKASIAILVLLAVLLLSMAHASQLGAIAVVAGGIIWFAHLTAALLIRHIGQNTVMSSRVLMPFLVLAVAGRTMWNHHSAVAVWMVTTRVEERCWKRSLSIYRDPVRSLGQSFVKGISMSHTD